MIQNKFFDELKTSIKRILVNLAPDVARETLAFPIKARVIQANTADYTVDVQPLRNNGEEIKVLDKDGTEHTVEPLKAVPVDTVSGPGARGAFGLPGAGAIVRVSFYGGDPAFPFVDGVLNDGPPTTEDGEMSLFRDAAHHIRMKPDGTILVKAPGNVTIEAGGDLAATCGNLTAQCTDATIEVSGTLNLGGTGGKDVARKDDPVEVDGKTGKITSGSSTVKAT